MTTLKLPIITAQGFKRKQPKVEYRSIERPPREVKEKPEPKPKKPVVKDYPIRTMYWPYNNGGHDEDFE